MGIAIALLLAARTTHAQEEPIPMLEQASDQVRDESPPTLRSLWRLADSPGLAIGVEAYGGNAVLMSSDDNRAHMVGGGQFRIRYGYFLIGGAAEIGAIHEESWRSFGGFAGAWLPCDRWVDFEAAAGISMRRLQDPDQRFGDAGYDVTLPALTLRVGLSDRMSERLIGFRAGFAIAAAVDLSRPTVSWQFPRQPVPEAIVSRGTKEPGGVTIGFVFTVGFDAQVTSRNVLGVRTEVAQRE